LALEAGLSEEVELAAHCLKGELGYLSISELSKCALDLEQKGRNGDLKGVSLLLPNFEAEVSRLLISIKNANDSAINSLVVAGSVGADQS
jgi:HPt (histidine-containing phosphotransfer) domain-containing protein